MCSKAEITGDDIREIQRRHEADTMLGEDAGRTAAEYIIGYPFLWTSRKAMGRNSLMACAFEYIRKKAPDLYPEEPGGVYFNFFRKSFDKRMAEEEAKLDE